MMTEGETDEKDTLDSPKMKTVLTLLDSNNSVAEAATPISIGPTKAKKVNLKMV